MLIEPFLIGLVIIRCNNQHAIGTGFFGVAGQLNRLARIVGACPRQHRHAASGLGNANFNHMLMLGMAQRGAFAGGAHGHKTMRAGFNLPVHKGTKGRLIHIAILEWRDKCCHGTLENISL